MPNTILMLAVYGWEMVEVGGTLALHSQAGDTVHAASLLSREDSRPQIAEAARRLGVQTMRFLGFTLGEVQPDVLSKRKIVSLIRELRPAILLTPDPEHAQHDLDPDRRLASVLILDAVALAGREWQTAECGGYEPHTISDLYYLSPERPDLVVDITETFAQKQYALDALNYQMAFSAQIVKERGNAENLRHLLPDYETLQHDETELGRALHHEMNKAVALSQGLAGHSHAVLGEAFRHHGVLTVSRLLTSPQKSP